MFGMRIILFHLLLFTTCKPLLSAAMRNVWGRGGPRNEDPRFVNGIWTWPPSGASEDSVGYNFDPDRANPRNAIICRGSLPPWPLPVFPEWNPNEHTTLQQVCAMPQFLGQRVGIYGPRSIPGYCGRFPGFFSSFRHPPSYLTDEEAHLEQERPSHTRFYYVDNYREANPQITAVQAYHRTSLYHSRLLYYCSQRCYCSEPLDPHTPSDGLDAVQTGQMPFTPRIKNMKLLPRESTFQMRIEKAPDFSERTVIEVDRFQVYVWQQLDNNKRVLSADIPHQDEVWRYDDPFGKPSFISFISLDPKNEIECNDTQPLPEFPLPPPASWRKFKNIKSLCAVTLSGGYGPANAGGFCRAYKGQRRGQISHQKTKRYDIWFSDELTPRLEWTWEQNFLFAGRVRRFCWQHCWCKNKPRPEPDERPHDLSVWQVLDAEDMIVIANRMKRLTLLNGKGAMFPIAPADGNYGPQASQCLVDGVDYCEQKPWPTDILGPVPSVELMPEGYSDDDEEDTNASLIASADDKCSISCTGPTSCKTRLTSLLPDCPSLSGVCAVDPRSKLKQSVVGGLSTALSTFFVATCQLQAPRPRLGGRSLEQPGMTEHTIDEWPCACNTSYVSHSCCAASDGIVSSQSGEHLGVLNLL